MYNQQGFQNSFQNNLGQTSSQYRGLETKYQPVGFVQSQYNQSLGQQNQFGASTLSSFGASSSQQYNQFQSPQSYHTASYRGNQPGHDAYLRSDSAQPAQSQFGIGATSISNLGASSLGSFGSASQAQYNQFQSPQSFHTASYRGDQPGHDAYLRADSTQPAQSQFGIGAQNFSSQSQFAPSSFSSSLNQGFSSTQSQYNQFQSPQSYHTANYRGNQPGHDSYLREDSGQPAQSQFGMGAQSFNRYQF
ncbi:hypothetical protein ACP26L_24870 [Paenibacillus sp. S-38]|uniref:hypothetical protein n=1 Tax=Paenibacillus sp. S-38 TaxID=3416710 RepID=UPI003CE89DCD